MDTVETVVERDVLFEHTDDIQVLHESMAYIPDTESVSLQENLHVAGMNLTFSRLDAFTAATVSVCRVMALISSLATAKRLIMTSLHHSY